MSGYVDCGLIFAIISLSVWATVQGSPSVEGASDLYDDKLISDDSVDGDTEEDTVLVCVVSTVLIGPEDRAPIG